MLALLHCVRSELAYYYKYRLVYRGIDLPKGTILRDGGGCTHGKPEAVAGSRSPDEKGNRHARNRSYCLAAAGKHNATPKRNALGAVGTGRPGGRRIFFLILFAGVIDRGVLLV